ncbi:MAG: hypothetical protein AB7U95_07205 [Reyranella sp.]
MNIFDRLANTSFPDNQPRNLGDEARDRKEWSKAATLYQQYLETAPEDAGIWVQLGHACKEERDLGLAEKCYLRALSIELLNPDTHLQLGHIEKLRGNAFQAMAWYRKALAISPDFEPAIEECRNLDSGGDFSVASGASSASSGEPDGGFTAWRGEMIERLGTLASSIDTLNAKVAEFEGLAPVVARHDVLLKDLPGRELVGRLDALTAIVSKHDATLQNLPAKDPAKEVVGRLDALTGLVSTLNMRIVEVENVAQSKRKDRGR